MNTDNSGQTIVEVIVVIGVVVLLATGLIAGTTASLRSAQSGRLRSQAVKYAEGGLEYVRNLRDQKWSDFQNFSGEYCLAAESGAQLLAALQGGCTGNITTTEGTFTRSITFSWDGSRMRVDVTVSYSDGGIVRIVPLSTYFTQWK